jgi:hypothetical protein
MDFTWEIVTCATMVWCGTILVTSCIFQRFIEKSVIRNKNGNV